MMQSRNTRREPKPKAPLTAKSLDWFALRYVERFATTASKLVTYLKGKLRERGWEGDGEPPIDAVVSRLVALGYVDDRAFGEARARGLERRGYGARRVTQALTAAGIEPELRHEIGDTVDARAAAVAFAKRKRLGPFATTPADPDQRRKQFAAMMRAGHAPGLAKVILAAESEAALDDVEWG